MIRKAFLIAAGLLAVLIATLGLALINANHLIAKYKPDLEQTLSRTLGAQVSFKGLEARLLSSKPRLRLLELRVSGVSGPAQEPPFTLRNVSLHLKLLPLLRKNLEITELSIQAPQVTLIKDQSGVHLSGLPQKEKTEQESTPPALQPTPKEASEPKQAQALGLNLNLQRIEIQEAVVVLKDTESKTDYTISRLFVETGLSLAAGSIAVHNLKLSADALGKVKLTIAAPLITLIDDELRTDAVLIKAADSTLSLSASYNLKTQSGSVNINGQELKLAGLGPFFPPAVKELGLRGSLKPTLKADLGPQGLNSAQGAVELMNLALNPKNVSISGLNGALKFSSTPELQTVHTASLDLLLNNQPLKVASAAVLHGKTLELNDLALGAFGGAIKGTVRVSLEGDKTFAADLEASRLSIEQMLSALAPAKAAIMAGTLEALRVKAEGASNNLPSSLRGTAYLAVKEGTLKGFNLAGDVLRAVNNIPFLAGALYNAVPAAELGAVDSNDTAVKSLTGNFSFANATISTRDLEAVSAVFSLAADGNLGFDSSLDLYTTIYFNKNFSTALAAQSKALQNILDTDGRLVIPLTLKGTPPKVIVLPNIEKLLEVGAKKAIQQKAGDLVQGILGGKQKGSTKGLGKLLGGF